MAETLRWWVRKFHELRDGFATKHPEPVLLQLARSEPSADESSAAKQFLTVSVGRSRHTSADPLELPVYPVRKGANNAFGMMITVGRANNNDIVVEASSISKFHAYLEARDGGWRVRDANSSNGTYVGATQVTAESSVEIPDGATVRFARVSLKFIGPESFRHMLSKEAARMIRKGELPNA